MPRSKVEVNVKCSYLTVHVITSFSTAAYRGRLWCLALPNTAKSPMKHKISTLLKMITSPRSLPVSVICCCFKRLGFCGRSRFLIFNQKLLSGSKAQSLIFNIHKIRLDLANIPFDIHEIYFQYWTFIQLLHHYNLLSTGKQLLESGQRWLSHGII